MSSQPVVIRLMGPQLGAQESDSLKDSIGGVIRAGTVSVILDLSDVEFMDSTILGVLVASMKRLTPLGGDIRLVAVRPNVLSVLEITRLDRVFACFKTVAEAKSSYGVEGA